MNRTATFLLVFLSATSLILLDLKPVSAVDRVAETVTLNPVANATVASVSELENATVLKVGRVSSAKWQIFLLFDLTSIPKDAKVEAANLILKSETFLPTGTRWVDAYVSSPDWAENTITWNNKPSEEMFLDTEWIELSGENYFWHCSDAFTENIAKFSLILDITPGTDGYVVFFARQSQYEPQLELKYSVGPLSLGDQILRVVSAGLGVASVIAVVYVAYLWRKGYFKTKEEKTEAPKIGMRYT
jgi:hypothetical protein